FLIVQTFLFQSSVQTFSNVLETKQDVAWNDLPLSGKKSVVSSLLQVLDESSLLLAETSSDDGSFSLVKANVLLSLQVLKSKNAKTMFFPVFGEIASENEAMNWMNMQDRLIIPHQAIEDYAKNGMYKVVFTAFNRLHNLLKPSSAIFQPTHGHISDNITRIINSRVIGAALDRRGNLKLYQPVVITLKHLVEENVTNPVCVYWDLHTRDWSAQGCWIESTNKSYTVCLCDHLTNFAVVMDLQMDMVTPVDLHHLHMIITTSCAFSVAALLLTVIILFSLSLDLSEDSTFIHRNMFLCLLISELVFLVGIKQTKHYIPCAIVAGLLQYLFLVIFSWMFFECYHQYVILIRSCNTKKEKFCWYYAAAYIIPGIITGTSAVVDPKSYGTEKYCWLQSDNYFVFSFVGPAVSIIFGGLVFLCITLCMFSHNLSMTSTLKDKDSANLQNY
ncbi:adhesion G protein-coupled receptor L1-like, partial [Stegodyphus dumicola]|uniref:adhesion G protein-coupled receptor L1-like n=1 Tax=Stegodyphus dumicola TaxID=202533 RepID=UPI0015AE356F